jgi:hypothetical protein
MIIKGESVAGAGRLAVHLQRADQNERVEILELRDVAAQNVRDALFEMEALAAATKAEKPFYHASINTLASERLTAKQRERAIEVLEEKLGLTGQPRVVVVHLKKDREHCHIVWSRIDQERMTAISDSHNYRKHEEAGRQLEREFGLTPVQGVHVERDGKPRPERTPSHAEMLQAQRTGLTTDQVKEQITALWRGTESGQAFADALWRQGYVLARGDRRDFVVIDPRGGTHSLARRIEGARVKDVRERLADLDPLSFPSVAEAKEIQRGRVERAADRNGLSPEALVEVPRHAPEGYREQSFKTHEPRGAEARAAMGAAKIAGSVLDSIATLFESAVTGEVTKPAPAPTDKAKPQVEPSVLADAEQKSKIRQELLREFGYELVDEREAEFERQRLRDRSR